MHCVNEHPQAKHITFQIALKTGVCSVGSFGSNCTFPKDSEIQKNKCANVLMDACTNGVSQPIAANIGSCITRDLLLLLELESSVALRLSSASPGVSGMMFIGVEESSFI